MTEQASKETIFSDDRGIEFTYRKLYSVSEFVRKYGEETCVLMLQADEKHEYQMTMEQLILDLQDEPDCVQNVQTALDAWRPYQDREPTDIEELANTVHDLAPEALASFKRIMANRIAAATIDEQEGRVEAVQKQEAAIRDKFKEPENVGAPLVDAKEEPELPSFEQTGEEADSIVQEATEGHEAEIAPSLDDYAATTEFDQDN